MLNIQVTSMDNAWSQDKLNTALNSLESQMKAYKPEETEQEFANFCYSGSLSKQYCNKAPKPITEVPLTGIDNYGNQYKVGKIDTNGTVTFCPISSTRHIQTETDLEWFDPYTTVTIGADFGPDTCPGRCKFRIGGDGPILDCNCLLWPCVCENLNPRMLSSIDYTYNYSYFYCGYPWHTNQGELPTDYVGWYVVGTNCCCVTVESFRSNCLTCTCCTCHMTNLDKFTDENGVAWTVCNQISVCCVYETWQTVPSYDPICPSVKHYIYIPVTIDGYEYHEVRPIFWCNWCNSRHWAWAECIATSFCPGSQHPCWSMGGWNKWYEGCNTLECAHDKWNPNNDYFHCIEFDRYSMAPVCRYASALVDDTRNCFVLEGCNCFVDGDLKNFALECAPDKWISGNNSIYYDKELYAKLKCCWDAESIYHRTYKSGYIATTNWYAYSCTCVEMCGTVVDYTYAKVDCWCWMQYGWNVDDGYLPIWFECINSGVPCYIYSCSTAQNITGDYVPCCAGWPVDYMHPCCYLETPYTSCPGSCRIMNGSTTAAWEPYCGNCPSCKAISHMWYNQACNNIYLPFNYCRLTLLYCVHQCCCGIGKTYVDNNININVRYRKARS